jgi:large subunit ribosomal protein L15
MLSLEKLTTKKKRRLGLGHGSGRMKTSGRGTKGQKARGKIPVRFEGGALAIVKRLPFVRGKGRNKVYYAKPIGINLEALGLLPAGTVVDIESLIKHNIVPVEARHQGVKLLGTGDVTKSLTVKLPSSKSAAEKIVKAGGTVEHE